MQRGFEQKRKYDFDLHVQTLRSIRMVAWAAGNWKKGTKPEKIFSLPMDDIDRPKLDITQDNIREFGKKFSRSFTKEERNIKGDTQNGKKQ